MKTENPSLNNRIPYLDCLRVVATLAVMMLHITAQNWYSEDIRSLSWQTLNVYNSAVSWCVPVFVMISGALFLPRDIDTKTLYKKYILRLVIAYVVWNAVYALLNPLLGLAEFSLGYLLRTLISGPEHMWFLPMIVGMYMCIPLLRPIARDRKLSRYFLLLALIFQALRPFLYNLAHDFGGSIGADAAQRFQAVFVSMDMHTILGYAGYFIAGYVLSHAELGAKARRAIYALGVLGLLATVGLTILRSYRDGAASAAYHAYFSLNVALMSAAVFVLFKSGTGKPPRMAKCMPYLSKISFGAYLVHVWIIDLVKHIGLETGSFTAILSVPCMTLIVALISFAISALLNKIPFVNKYLV